MTELLRIGDVTRGDQNCPVCQGEGWICENHPDTAWGDGLNCCGGAGAPCRCTVAAKTSEAMREATQAAKAGAGK